jgi:hypothetical protein
MLMQSPVGIAKQMIVLTTWHGDHTMQLLQSASVATGMSFAFCYTTFRPSNVRPCSKVQLVGSSSNVFAGTQSAYVRNAMLFERSKYGCLYPQEHRRQTAGEPEYKMALQEASPSQTPIQTLAG